MKRQARRFMYLLLSFVFLATTMLGFSGPASADTLVPLSSLKTGNTVNFAGYTWIVLDPTNGYLLIKNAIKAGPVYVEMSFEPMDVCCWYYPGDRYNIAHYLNNDFYDSLPSADRPLIQTHSWTVGDETNESSRSTDCKIGLISYSEYNTYTQNAKNFSIISNNQSGGAWWLRTHASEPADYYVWMVVPGLGYLCKASANGNGAVHPSLYLNPGIFVSGGDGGTVIPFDPSKSTVTASPPQDVFADGTTGSTVTVTLEDSGGSPVSGVTVNLTANSTTTGITPASTGSNVTDSSGQASFTVTDTKAETVTYTATDTTDNNVKVGTATVQFTPGPAYTLLGVSPTSVPADGTNATVVATVYDANNNPVPKAAVTFSNSLGSLSTTSPVLTDTNGQATDTITSTTAGTATVQAQVTGCKTVSNYVYFTPTMTVTGLVPSYGPVAGGTLVTVEGLGLSTASAVYFGSSPGKISGTPTCVSLSVFAPPGYQGGGSVNVTVYGSGGPSAETAADTFNYIYGGTVWPQPVTSTTGSAPVSPMAGGMVGLGSNATVTIPAGALQGTANATVSVQATSSPPAAPSGFTIQGQVYQFTVNGQDHYTFNGPVPLTFKFDPSKLPPGSKPAVSYYDDSASKWVDIGGAVDWTNDTVTVTVDHFTEYTVMAQVQPAAVHLRDIAGNWAQASIENMVALGAITGYPDGTFRPDNDITRAEFVTVLVKALKLTPKSGPVFADAQGSWAQSYISTAAADGIVTGYNSTHFGPNDLVTREQMTAMVVRADKLAPVSGTLCFTDAVNIDAWARGYVETAVKDGILNGYPDGTFRPLKYATRAEAVTVIAKLLK